MQKRNIYVCNISDNEGQPEFSVSFNEENFAEVTYSEPSASGKLFWIFISFKDLQFCILAAWSGILQPLAQLRSDAGMLKLFSSYLAGEVLFGLTESSIVKMIESVWDSFAFLKILLYTQIFIFYSSRVST